MDLAQWQRLSPLLDELLELEGDRRRAELERLHAEDAALAAELTRLLALEAEHDDFLTKPLVTPGGTLAAGDLIGPYRLTHLLGEGGMGLVWLAERADGLYQRRVALKLLRPGLANPDLRLRFSREREIMARLQHPHIASLLDAGIGGEGQPYLALEFVEGEPIIDYASHHGLPIAARLKLFLQVCDAVSHAHANLVVHRDLKPSNILVTPSGDVRLLDFGIAKLLHSAEPAAPDLRPEGRSFTLHYAAPEQVRGEPVTTMTDVYSLGVVLCELLAEAKPYRLRRQSDSEWEEAILNVEPMKPSVAVMRSEDKQRPRKQLRQLSRQLSGDLDNIVLRALAKEPGHRYASVEAMALDIERYLQGRPVQAKPQGLIYILRKYVRRHRWPLLLWLAFVSLLLAALLISVLQTRQAQRETARAQAMQNFVLGLFDNVGANNGENQLEVRAMLDAGEHRANQELAKQPLAHAELLGTIAQLRIGLGDYSHAQTLLNRQRELLAGLDSVPPSVSLDAAMRQGQVAYLLGDSRRCLQVMEPALPLANRSQGGLSLATAAFLTQEGRCHRALGERLRARSLFLRAQTIHRDLGNEVGVAESMAELALLDSEIVRSDTSINALQAALDHLRANVGEHHPSAIEILRQLGNLYRLRGDTELALATNISAQQQAEAFYGKDHPITIRIRRQTIAVLIDQGKLQQAETQLEQLSAQTAKALGPKHRETGLSLNSLGIIAWERGQYDRAINQIQQAVAIWRARDGTYLLHGGLYNLGMVLHDAGRQAEALAALNEARKLRVTQYGASSVLVGDTDRMIGEVLSSMDRNGEALVYLERASALARIGYPEDHPRRLEAELSLAHFRARNGQADLALPVIDALTRVAGEGSEEPKLRWRARAYAAESRCKLGQVADSQRELQSLLDELARKQPDGGVVTREVQAIRAACR